MRARRLRRLGVSGSAGSAASSSQTIPNELQDSQKNDIKSALRTENSDEKDEVQHKQKQLKFDDEIIKDSVLNNNDTASGRLNKIKNIYVLRTNS